MTPGLDASRGAVTVDADFGRAAPSLGWVPAPRYLLRRAMVLEWMSTRAPGRILEVGAGAATLLADLAPRGFTAEAVETSPRARVLGGRLLHDLPQIHISGQMPAADERFDYLFAFEVLEHIEGAVSALTDWVAYVRSGGRVFLSVPAYARRWTATDTWAGHVRRYDREDLVALAEAAGLRVVQCRHYGYPLADLLEPLNARRHARVLAAGVARDVGTAASGVARSAETRAWPLLSSWAGRLAMRAAIAAQRRFPERGNGLLLEAEKP